MASPDKFLTQVEILDGDGVPIAGGALANFSFALGEPGSETPTSSRQYLQTSAAVMGQQWFVIRSPGGLSPDPDGTPKYLPVDGT